jgi:hypothetical protein
MILYSGNASIKVAAGISFEFIEASLFAFAFNSLGVAV